MRREDFATFDDRYTLRYVRVFPVSIERVWRAVTTSEELNLWFFPVTRLEPRLHGAVSFTWGGPERTPQVGEVTVFEPLRRTLALILRHQDPSSLDRTDDNPSERRPIRTC